MMITKHQPAGSRSVFSDGATLPPRELTFQDTRKIAGLARATPQAGKRDRIERQEKSAQRITEWDRKHRAQLYAEWTYATPYPSRVGYCAAWSVYTGDHVCSNRALPGRNECSAHERKPTQVGLRDPNAPIISLARSYERNWAFVKTDGGPTFATNSSQNPLIDWYVSNR